MAIIFTDTNARTVLLRAQRREADSSQRAIREDKAHGPSADEILLGLLAKVPQENFLRLPVRISDEP